MNFISTTHKGCVRDENQDFLGNQKTRNGHVFIVCDGVSGLPNGALASHIAVESILSTFLENSDSPEIMIQKSLTNAHNNVVKASTNNIGTTVTLVYFEEGIAYAAWCGDSRIYQFRDYAIEWMSRDHNILHDILNKGHSRGDIFQNPQAITRFLGRIGNHKPDIHKFYVDTNDKILLCSDGLHGFVVEPDIVQTITKFSINKANDILENKLLSEKLGAPDNFTWYIISI